MTAPRRTGSTAQEQAGAVAGTARDQAASVAQSATSAAAEVSGTAKEQVSSVVGETVAQARDLSGQVRQQAAQQVSTQTENATTALRGVAKQLTEGDTSGMVGTVLTEVGQRVQGLADALERKGPQGLLDDVRRYARRSPGSFLVGAAVAGLVTGRLVKGMQPQPPQPERLALTAGQSGPVRPAGTTSTTGTTAGDQISRPQGTSRPVDSGDERSTVTFGVPTYGGAPPSSPPYPGTGAAGSPSSAGYGGPRPYGPRDAP